MPSGQLGSLMQHLRRLVGGAAGADTPDALLLQQFTEQADEAAFGSLVARHGPLVLGVCRRVLHDEHQAEDAFQAVFMVLAKRASAIRRPEALSSWLYGVAYKASARLRAGSLQRYTQESQVPAMGDPNSSEPDALSEATRRELRAVIDEELSRLPDKYRLPMILCYLEGKTNEEAARQLNWTKGTVSGQLARARDLLRNRLARRGVALSAGILATALAQNAASASVSQALLASTVQGAILFNAGKATGVSAALAHSTLQSMFAAKVKVAAAVLVIVGALAGTGGVVAYQAWHGDTKPQATAAPLAPTGEVKQAPEAKNLDPHRADQVPLVLRVRKHGEDRQAQENRWQPVVIIEVLKNTTGERFDKTLLVASSVHKHGIPPEECTIYLEPLQQAHADGHWKLLGGGMPEGVSHVAAAPSK
jgi:RNA polymerase sigma factor (sigma-70 family)